MARGVNERAIAFLRAMNAGLKKRHPHALLIAEDSSAYPGVTKPAEDGCLGFDYKWDLGFMHDTLDFLRMHPQDRRAHPERLTFSMFYFYNERYLLPLSHDEVVHGKATIAGKMHGDSLETKLAQARLLYLYMFAHPGAKLNFMGHELAMLREWDEHRELDRLLLKFPLHDGFARFMRRLNQLYALHPALWALDHDPEGFTWLILPDERRALCAFTRQSKGERVLAVFNFDDHDAPGLCIPLEHCGRVTLLLDTNAARYGGNALRPARRTLRAGVLRVNVPRLSGQLYLLGNPSVK